jgi:soluble lytic murein transglycosylase-like protein
MFLTKPQPAAKAPVSQPDGCFSHYLLAPLAVLATSGLLVLAFVSGGLTPRLPSPGPLLAALTPSGGTTAADPALTTFVPGSSSLSPLFTREVLFWQDDILAWAVAAGLDPNLVATVMQIESCGDPRAVSPAGALGLFQVMPNHFLNGEDPFNPDTNARRGLEYLRGSLSAAGLDPRLALAGYNGGLAVIGEAESRWPLETQRYAFWGSGIYQDASAHLDQSLRLQEWLLAGGSNLCHQARVDLGLDD